MGWFRQQLMYKTSSDEMLAKQAQYAKKPSKRVAAYYGLASRRSDKCFDVLLNKLTDKDSLWSVKYMINDSRFLAIIFHK